MSLYVSCARPESQAAPVNCGVTSNAKFSFHQINVWLSGLHMSLVLDPKARLPTLMAESHLMLTFLPTKSSDFRVTGPTRETYIETCQMESIRKKFCILFQRCLYFELYFKFFKKFELFKIKNESLFLNKNS